MRPFVPMFPELKDTPVPNPPRRVGIGVAARARWMATHGDARTDFGQAVSVLIVLESHSHPL